MSNDKQETIEDIVAAMRNEGHAGDASCLEWVGAKLLSLADRIEAAHKTEIKQIKFNFGQGDCVKCAEVPDESCKYYGEPDGCNFRSLANILRKAEVCEMIGREATREKSSQVGNAAKIREALSDACYAMFNFLKTQNGGYEEMAKALDKAKAALAEPPRNCDRPECATTKAAQDVWRKEDGGKTAYYEWLLAESTKGETK